MPTVALDGWELELSRVSALLDTNVLVALFYTSDQEHEQAQAVLDVWDNYTWLVLPPVIIEAAGMLWSRTKNHSAILGMLRWMLDPGNKVVLLPDPNHPLTLREVTQRHSLWINKFSVDFVDSYIMQSADRLTRVCALKPHMPVFTFDTGDFLKCARSDYLFSLFDMRTADELIEFA